MKKGPIFLFFPAMKMIDGKLQCMGVPERLKKFHAFSWDN